MAFWSWSHSTCFHCLQSLLHLTHVLHRIQRLRCLKPSLPRYALRFTSKSPNLLLCFWLKLRQIGPKLLIHGSIHIRIVIAFYVYRFLHVQFFSHPGVGQVVLDVFFVHFALTKFLECREVVVDQSFELAFYFVVDLGEFSLKGHPVSEDLLCAVEWLIRHLLRRNLAR